MYLGECTKHVATQLGLVVSTVIVTVEEVFRLLCEQFQEEVRFPVAKDNVAKVIDGFNATAGLPYCVGAIDGTHIKWHWCPQEQYYEYQYYKRYPSFVIFVVCTADREVTDAQVGKCGVARDATILKQSSLLYNIGSHIWLGTEISSMRVGNVEKRRYLLEDCAFNLTIFMMGSCTKTEKAVDRRLEGSNAVATSTRKPIGCVLGILKFPFPILIRGF